MKKRVKIDVTSNKQAAAVFTGSMVAWCDHADVQVTCSPHDDDVSVQVRGCAEGRGEDGGRAFARACI